jgi:hypothetical protein
VKKKELYDKEFLNHKHIMAINTAVNDVNATLDLIAKVCSKVPEVNLTKKRKGKIED